VENRCVNFLLVESLLRFYMFYGNSLQIECPTGSGDYMHLGHVAEELQHRLQHLFTRNDNGRRAVNDGNDVLDFDPHWKDYLWFYEFFDGDSGRGLGATHQCGWSGLIAKMIHDTGINCRLPQTPRTPGSAAAHYFDDTFGRGTKDKIHGRKKSYVGTPGPDTPRMRRSSTSRSIGTRSDWGPATGHVNGHGADSYFPDEPDETAANTHANTYNAPSVPANSAVEEGSEADQSAFGHEEALERERRRSVADSHLERYVEEQLRRIRTDESTAVYEDEFEAMLEG
jgi:hypothetical protein